MKNKAEYILESVLLQSERLSSDVELNNMVTDVDLFEHLDKPYLTAQITIIDNERLYENADLLGGERISIKIKSTRPNTVTITNNFYIKKIVFDEKHGDNTQVLSFHLIEDIAFISNLKNINKAYNGKISTIIERIADEYLDVGVESDKNDKQNINVIIPNLNPIESIKWLTQRASTIKGYPFFVFSTMASNKLHMVDLGKMLKAPVINPYYPYRYNMLSASSIDEDKRRRVIKGYKMTGNAEDLASMIQKGLIGANYNFIDTYKDKQISGKYNLVTDLLKNVIEDELLKQQPNINYSTEYKHNEKSYDDFQSRTISILRSSGAYKNHKVGKEPSQTKSYGEANELADYKLEIISRSMDNLLKKSVLTIVVPGLDFIDGNKHSTISNQIRVEFQNSDALFSKDVDKKKSGNYLIYSVRHQFKKEKYDAILTLVKMGNMKR